MDTRWKKFSHSIIVKVIVFMIVILCFSSALTLVIDVAKSTDGNFAIAFEESYYLGNDYISDSTDIVNSLRGIIKDFFQFLLGTPYPQSYQKLSKKDRF